MLDTIFVKISVWGITGEVVLGFRFCRVPAFYLSLRCWRKRGLAGSCHAPLDPLRLVWDSLPQFFLRTVLWLLTGHLM